MGPVSPDAPKPNLWRRATATTGQRVWLGIASLVLVGLLFSGFAIASILVLRHHDRVGLAGQRLDRHSMGQGPGQRMGPGNGRGNGNGNGNGKQRRLLPGSPANPGAPVNPGAPANPGIPGNPGGPGGQVPRLPRGLGNLFNLGALHGNVTASIGGSVQVLLFQRGQVTAVSATSISLKSSDGFTGTYARNASTKVTGAAPVQGGQAVVLARASDKVALRTVVLSANGGATPNS